MRRWILVLGLVAAAGLSAARAAEDVPYWADAIAAGDLPPVAERLPDHPLVVDDGRALGAYGGDWRMLINRAKDTRLLVVFGYARLVAYDENLDLVPDILESFEVEDGRIFTFHLRPGHKWSDGAPFTAEDFRYWWEDVALNDDLSPAGPPSVMLVDNKPPPLSK